MKLNEIDFDLLSDNELINLCLKYKLIDLKKIHLYQRKNLLDIIRTFLLTKLKTYGQRRNSINGNLQRNQLNYQHNQGPPKPGFDNRQRRLSQPITNNEVRNAQQTHQQNVTSQNAQRINQLRFNFVFYF